MNFLRRQLFNIKQQISNSQENFQALVRSPVQYGFLGIVREKSNIWAMHRKGPHMKHRPSKNPLGFNVPQLKGVVLKTLIKKPRKPNSGNRKCVLLRLSNGKEMVAHVPGEGHNLQEHNIVLVRVGRTKDTPGLKLKCIRGKYDLPHVVKKVQQ